MVQRSGITNESHETEGEEKEDGDVVQRSKDRNNRVSVHRRSNHQRDKREN